MVKNIVLISHFPKDEWFNVRPISEQLKSKSTTLDRRVAKMPFLQKRVVESRRVEYYISKLDFQLLVDWAVEMDNYKSNYKTKQKITHSPLSIPDICQNIAEGWHRDNVLPS